MTLTLVVSRHGSHRSSVSFGVVNMRWDRLLFTVEAWPVYRRIRPPIRGV
jgi:hypothetical protein